MYIRQQDAIHRYVSKLTVLKMNVRGLKTTFRNFVTAKKCTVNEMKRQRIKTKQNNNNNNNA